jgi:A/G-specific adenine glycosylase
MKPAALLSFQQTVQTYYTQQGRHDLPWRLPETKDRFDPYKVVVSELMLQQTQVARVIPKYHAFVAAFPTVQALAAAPLGEVLTLWSGLGYNRRAKFLWSTAGTVVDQFNGTFPQTSAELVTLPGIGPNTAGAILAYAFNQPVVFIETNVRTVFIHHFFADQAQVPVPDAALLPFIATSLPNDDARNWYWALMDYGTHLKQTVGNAGRASASYAKQSAFQGSRRQIRGQVLRLLTSGPHPRSSLAAKITDERLPAIVDDLIREGLIENNDGTIQLHML